MSSSMSDVLMIDSKLKSLSRRLLLILLTSFSALMASFATNVALGATIAEVTEGIERQEGFVPFYWDEKDGRVLLEIPAFNEDILYYVSAASGGGSVELGLDRGILSSVVVHFEKIGQRVLVKELNLDYRALADSETQGSNVDASFPSSVLASLPIVAEDDGQVLVNGNALFLQDAGGLETRLRRANQGSFRYDASRSTYYPARMRAFAENTEIETISTFSVENPGVATNNVLANNRTMSVRIHHSFLKAPVGYVPRKADPRIGVSSIDFRNYSESFENSTETNWVTRWRLEKQDPDAPLSDPIKPIIFYLDPAVPEPVRSAMKEGTLWWNKAFEAAGFSNAVQVRDPTPDMDPMDIRYAWILWIDRDERGFSSGGTFRDPRTGEILGSKTRMDSHRIRTIANYYEAYTILPEQFENASMPEQLSPEAYGMNMPDGQRDMVLLRQALLTAHELGHVMGFGHNWASSINDRASVMEYPTPRVKVVDGELDLSESFEYGTGLYDDFLARYAYTVFTAEDEAAGLDAIIAEMREAEILYVPSTDPRWAWYDDRATPTEYLEETLAAREIMLAQYGSNILEEGEAIGSLRDLRLWMNYLHHRYAIEAGQRYVGGLYHNIVVKGETLPPTELVPADLQREVLALLMEAISPESLRLSEELLAQLTPSPHDNLEDMSADYAFDQIGAARTLSAMVIEPLFAADKTARMVALADRDPNTLTLPEMLATIFENTWLAPEDADPRDRSLRRVTQWVTLHAMMMLGADDDVSPEVRAYILDQLAVLEDTLESISANDPLAVSHLRQAKRDIDRYLDAPEAFGLESAAGGWGKRPRSRFPLPPGPPL